MKQPRKLLYFLGVCQLAFTLSVIRGPFPAFAQDLTTGVAYRIELQSGTGFDGAVICSQEGGFGVCQNEYDPKMHAVQTNNPGVYFEEDTEAQGVLVMSEGIVMVAVNNAGGDITAGDYVTTSSTPGLAQRATDNGFVLGTAMDAFSGEGRGSIRVALKIGPVTTLSNTRSNLVTVLQNASNASQLSPLDSFRYLIAALMALISFGLGFTYFGRMSRTGVEAIGRNPLAVKQIQFNVLLHVGVAILIVLVGLGVAYMILII